MTACGRIVVTAGPTISAADIRSVVPDAEVAPPIAFGQALSYDLRSGDTLLIVDGLFFQQPSVRHKELLTLMADGVRVVGSSSMGALRAAELHPFGMEGYGWVFESYRDGVLEADDEVGVVHGDADDGYPVFVDALVNMRHTLARAVATGVVCSELAERIIETARATPFTMRTWARLLSEVGAPDQRGLAAQLRSLRVDVKHADALLALRQLGQRPRVEPLRPGPPPTVWSRRWRQRWAPPTSVAASADHGESFVDVTDLEVLSFLSVSSVDYWAYRPALQQVAAWYWTLKHPEQSGSVGERAARAVAEVASEGYGRALEFIAYRYALATGIIDETGFPEAVAAHWLTTEERHGLGNDPISISARMITRTLFVVRLLPAIDHFLDLLRKDSRLPRWRAMAAHALCKRDDLARQKPHLNLGRPDPTQLKRLFGARWGTQVNRIELARRGLMTEDAFYAAATPFAVAAVDDQLPRIEVGTLGPAPLSADVPERHFDFGSV